MANLRAIAGVLRGIIFIPRTGLIWTHAPAAGYRRFISAHAAGKATATTAISIKSFTMKGNSPI
jgi:hypothetical protein